MASSSTSCAECPFHGVKQSAVSLGQEIKTTLAWNNPKEVPVKTYQFPGPLRPD
jgi:hypothetical protein